MKLTFVGCGDAFGTGGRFNTCFYVEGDKTAFLIDCGATSMTAIRHHGIDPNTIDTILLTHLHGDHFHAVAMCQMMPAYFAGWAIRRRNNEADFPRFQYI